MSLLEGFVYRNMKTGAVKTLPAESNHISVVE